MLLKEIFTQLTYGELSQIGLGGNQAGEISEKNYERILVHVNLGLTALHKRFLLKEGRLNINLQDGMYTYSLKPGYVISNTRSKEPVKYITDVPHKFKNDILKVERAYSDTGKEFGLNDESDDLAIMTPSYDTLRIPRKVVDKNMDIPDDYKTSGLEIVYRANHPIIPDTVVAESYEVELPYTHLEPLLLFIASRVNNPIGLNNEFNAGNTYAAKYEAACAELEKHNLQVDKQSQNTRLEKNGWV